MRPWESATIESNATLRREIGPLRLWVRRAGDEWHVATEHEPTGTPADNGAGLSANPDVPSEGLEWHRWVVGEKSGILLLKPAMPDRPVVVRPEYSVRVPPKQHAVFYVGIPIWVQVTVGDGKRVLCEEPTVMLSNIWFGDYASGELCYSLQTRARRDIDDTDQHSHRAVCPVKVTNSAKSELDFQRLCIRVSHLRILERNDRLWTDQVNVTYRGEDEESRIEYGKGKKESKGDGAETVLAEPRDPPEGSIIRKSFRNLRSLNIP